MTNKGSVCVSGSERKGLLPNGKKPFTCRESRIPNKVRRRREKFSEGTIVFAFEIEKIPLKFNLFLDFNTRPERISPAADELLQRIGLSRQPEGFFQTGRSPFCVEKSILWEDGIRTLVKLCKM